MALYIDPRYDSFWMMCIDPGYNHLGIVMMLIETRTGRIMRIMVESIITDKTPSFSGFDRHYVTERAYKLRKIYDWIYRLCELYNPDVLAHETPFFNPKMPAAFGSLTEVCMAVKDAVLDYNSNTIIEGLSPQSVKMAVGAAGKKGKEIMTEKVLGIAEIRNVLEFPEESLTEHCIDAMAVGYAVKTTILKEMEDW